MSQFETFWRAWVWREIRGCPGRLVLVVQPSPQPELLAPGLAWVQVRSPHARDLVWLAPFEDGGGLLSYQRPGGDFVHTLNTAEGFARKRLQLGV